MTMILPTKNLDQNRALIEIGAELISLLKSPKTISNLWDSYKLLRKNRRKPNITFDWFVLALDFLYIMAVIDYETGKIRRVNLNAQTDIQ